MYCAMTERENTAPIALDLHKTRGPRAGLLPLQTIRIGLEDAGDG